MHILVAEDDENIRTGLVDTLESEGYKTSEAGNGLQALERFSEDADAFDLILLDIMMPGKNGYDVCREIRATDTQIPIIMLTAKSEEIDKVLGLELGADDYITKPFGVHELLARVSAVLRRAVRTDPGEKEDASGLPFDFGGCRVDPKTFQLTGDKKVFDLSKREVELIHLFHAHPREVLSRDQILNALWGIDYLGTTRTLDQHIAQLRKKVEPDPSHPKVITTVHGVGYRYNG